MGENNDGFVVSSVDGVSLDCLNQHCTYFTGQKYIHSNHTYRGGGGGGGGGGDVRRWLKIPRAMVVEASCNYSIDFANKTLHGPCVKLPSFTLSHFSLPPSPLLPPSLSPLPPPPLPPSPSQSVRDRRLNRVRELFLKSFRNSIPETPSGGAGQGSCPNLPAQWSNPAPLLEIVTFIFCFVPLILLLAETCGKSTDLGSIILFFIIFF